MYIVSVETGDDSTDQISHGSLLPATGPTTPESATYGQVGSPAESDKSSQIVKGNN